jgi:hypothetical protein
MAKEKKVVILTRHHRRPRSKRGTDHDSNISIVPSNKHEAWHLLFSNKEPHEIAKIINEVWLDPDYHFVAVYGNEPTFYNH